MEMLIFFFVSILAGVLAAYFVERSHPAHKEAFPFKNNQDFKNVFSRLNRISREL
jgi:heme/copper-type cytochrome/quinol oxidase subunit 1